MAEGKMPWSRDLTEYFNKAVKQESLSQSEIEWFFRVAWNLALDMINNNQLLLSNSYLRFAHLFFYRLTDKQLLMEKRLLFMTALVNLELQQFDTCLLNLNLLHELLNNNDASNDTSNDNDDSKLVMLACQTEWQAVLKIKDWKAANQLIEKFEKFPIKFLERLIDISMRENSSPEGETVIVL